MDIKKLTRKKTISGKEIGQALLYLLTLNIEARKNDKEPQTNDDLVDQARDKMKDTTKNKHDLKVYIELHKELTNLFNMSQTFQQQFYNGFNINFNILHNIIRTERTEQELKRYPLILTDSEYNTLYKRAIKNKEKNLYSIDQIILELLRDALSNINNSKYGKITKELKQLQGKNNNYQKYLAYFETLDNQGFFELEDGRTSKDLTPKQWEKALDTLETITGNFRDVRRYQLTKLFFEGADKIRAEYQKATGQKTKATEKELLESTLMIIKQDGYYNQLAIDLDNNLLGGNFAKWKRNEPEQPNKMDDFAFLKLLMIKHKPNTIKSLKIDFVALYDVLCDYVISCLPKLKGKPTDQPLLTYQDTKKIKLLNIMPNDTEIIQEYKTKNKVPKLFFRGIARAKEPFIIPKIPYMDNLEDMQDQLEGKELIRNNSLIVTAYERTMLYNSLLECVEKVYNIDNLVNVASLDILKMLNATETYNGILYSFYAMTEDDKKRELIKKFFQPIDIDIIQLSGINRAIKKEILEDLEKTAFQENFRKVSYYIGKYRGADGRLHL